MHYLLAGAGILLVLSGPVFGQTRTPTPAQAAQQERMRSCNATAGDRTLKGDARKTFMSACLSGKQTPQLMMKVCNAEATQEGMAADARKTYLATCLSGDAVKG